MSQKNHSLTHTQHLRLHIYFSPPFRLPFFHHLHLHLPSFILFSISEIYPSLGSCFHLPPLSPSLAMLSTSLRVSGRRVAARDTTLRTVIVGARHASAWSNVPQGPPVKLLLSPPKLHSAIAHFSLSRTPFWVSPRPSRPTPSRRRSTSVLAPTVRIPSLPRPLRSLPMRKHPTVAKKPRC